MRALKIHSDDNVAVALETIPIAAEVIINGSSSGILARNEIEFGHKVAICPIAAGGAIRKYGAAVGFAAVSIPPGAWVHIHNVKSFFTEKRKAGQR